MITSPFQESNLAVNFPKILRNKFHLLKIKRGAFNFTGEGKNSQILERLCCFEEC